MTDEESTHPGLVETLEINEDGVLLIRWEEGGVSATEAPPWLRALTVEVRERWKQVQGGLYWPELDRSLQLPVFRVDLGELLREVHPDLRGGPTEKDERMAALAEFFENKTAGPLTEVEWEALILLLHRELTREEDEDRG